MRTELHHKYRQDCRNQERNEHRIKGTSSNAGLDLGEEAQFEEELLDLAPFLRSYGRVLSGNKDTAEDLTQETLLRAWRARASFKRGTILKAWLCVILRNKFFSDVRRAGREVGWDQEAVNRISASRSAISVWRSEQAVAVDLTDMVRALKCLSKDQREALILVGAGGFSTKDAAGICGCAVGTIRSRVARARKSLTAILECEGALPLISRPAAARSADEIMSELALLTAGTGSVGLHTARTMH